MQRRTYRSPYLCAPYGEVSVSFDLKVADLLLRIFGRPYDSVRAYIYSRCYGSSKRKALRISLRTLFRGVLKWANSSSAFCVVFAMIPTDSNVVPLAGNFDMTQPFTIPQYIFESISKMKLHSYQLSFSTRVTDEPGERDLEWYGVATLKDGRTISSCSLSFAHMIDLLNEQFRKAKAWRRYPVKASNSWSIPFPATLLELCGMENTVLYHFPPRSASEKQLERSTDIRSDWELCWDSMVEIFKTPSSHTTLKSHWFGVNRSRPEYVFSTREHFIWLGGFQNTWTRTTKHGST